MTPIPASLGCASLRLGQVWAASALLVLTLGTSAALAGPDLVAYPADYRTRFVLYNSVDRPDNKGVRLLYANPEAVAATAPGAALPNGTVLVMEVRKAKVDDQGAIVYDSDGRMVATEEITNVFVQEKRTGWGAEYPAGIRNGEWEYAAFTKDGARNPSIASYEACFKCHTSRTQRDYNFTFSKWVLDGKK